ncbi:uncharacterized protein SETTUDRAFT_152831 [Exserohilum turcica Et28A]|uniref:Uncharacterized protein n=1 Tax=Exserohilum turcicum (strain 28A) TaxID=671987 RepID=R0KG16_EXST2|nr:uncharacterized protein SETTUDRAFT_152831 [Exserohilum turcica Et28A]EOA91788.1 hypothetical protein SETTUDRAFT_152831 [Exserohilum turcica Et28A]
MSQSQTFLTLANVLGKTASAALIIPTSEALGQLKWHWFHDSKEIWDFEIFDKASRGAWGAALLLFRTKGRSLAALGALLIVLLLAIDTFFQQVTTLPDRWTLHKLPGEIPYVVRYEPLYQKETQGGFEASIINTELQPIVQDFLYKNGTKPVRFGNGNRPEIPLSCPTSNCTWPEYDTLAVCGTCKEVSDLLNITFACLNTTIDWSTAWEGPLSKVPYPKGQVCGHFLNITAEQPILLSGYSIKDGKPRGEEDEALLFRTYPLTAFLTKKRLYGVGSVAFKNIRNPILHALVASAVDGPESVYQNKTPIVHECFLSWCVNTIKSSYGLGEYNEEVISSQYNHTMGPSPWDSWEIPEDQGGGTFIVYKEEITITPAETAIGNPMHTNRSIIYGVNNVTAAHFMSIFDDFFPSSYSINKTESTIPRLRYKDYMNGPCQRFLPLSPWLAPSNVTRHIERLATAMTDRVRSSSSNQMLLGEASYTEKFVSVQWEWLIFPLLLLLLTLIFLVLTIIKTSKDTLPKEAQTGLDPSSTWSSADPKSKKVRIKLMPNMGWRVSGQGQARPTPPPGWL